MSYTPKDLRIFETLSEVPDSELQWLIDHCEIQEYEEGTKMFAPDDAADFMYLIMEGEALFYIMQNGERRDFGTSGAGVITGLLPYSRMKVARGNGVALKRIKALVLHRSQMRQLTVDCPETTAALVQQMTTRVRDFTSRQQQVDKLAALGKLSAGLAHELNNPASAIVRSADFLKEHLGHVPDRFKKVISMRLNDASIDSVNGLASAKIEAGVRDFGMMERADKEDELLDWLDDHDIDYGDDWVEQLVEYGVTADELEEICQATGSEALGPTLGWLVNVLTTERIVEEIKEASSRISDLVQSVKNYSYMDRSTDKQSVSPLEGLRNTMRMLEHKARKNQVVFDEDFDEQTGEVRMYPSEMNQVWTNIIDNALDALEESEDSVITIKTERKSKNLVVSIIDNGPGIPEDVQEEIFSPFFTTKEMGKGTGLGLDVVKRIIDQHGGFIELLSQPGRTEFRITLPTE
ncbi:GHKL domain-containing protein [Cryomorphaceae bacterium]|nr:GHKL domain-containing protein [Cryomorphaceae bacterium]